MTSPQASGGDEQRALVETLAAGVAHEIRNPLNSVQINLSILEQELKELVPDGRGNVFTVLGKIASEVKRLDDFVSEFLRFARPPRREPEWLPVAPLVRELASFIGPECAKKGVALELDLRGPERAWLDGFGLKQAILNLVLNALQATPAGGRVVLRTEDDGGGLRASVVDDGEGMSAETQARALTPFFTTRADGTGLGLPLVEQVVRRHGGRIEVASAAGAGTTVSLCFPPPPREGARP